VSGLDWALLGGDPVPADPVALQAMASGWRRAAEDVDRYRLDAAAALERVSDAWRGKAASAWCAGTHQIVRRLGPTGGQLESAAGAVSRFASIVEDLQMQARSLLQQAQAAQADAAATAPSPLELPLARTAFFDASPQGVEHAAAEQRLAWAQRQAGAVREQYEVARQVCVRALEQATTAGLAARSAVLSDRQLHDLALLAWDEASGDDAAIGALLAALTPSERAAFFADLTPAAARALALDDPSGIGNLNGVPLLMRGIANRAAIETDLAAAQAAGDTDRVRFLQGLIPAGATLVLYQPDLDHYAVLWGNPDAAHVAVFVPGVGDDSNVAGWVQDADRVYFAAGTHDSAVIMWKGYHDPNLDDLADAVAAGLTDRATAGAKDLSAFCTDGLQLAAGQSLTIVGHSYGSLVTGEALAHDGLRPTNVVVAGSPGMDVDDLGQLHLRSDQFYAEHAPQDYVANDLRGFGTDPSSPPFGGHRLATNGDGYPTVRGHSAYFDTRSRSLSGIADVIDGHVQPGDLQRPDVGDYAGAATARALDLQHAGLDELTKIYHGPGSGVLQGIDHADNAVDGIIGTGARDTVDFLDEHLDWPF
jgi:hypothetical protein